MGYSTEFEGILNFKNPCSVKVATFLCSTLGGDIREFDPARAKSVGFCYVDLKLTDDLLSLEWDGCEKTYDMEGIVNYITEKAREIDPEFCLTGEMLAQGDRIEDRWILRMVDGVATHIDTPPTGKRITCPHCEGDFYA